MFINRWSSISDKIFILLIIFSLAAGCRQNRHSLFLEEISSIHQAYVPDNREGIFDVRVEQTGKGIILKGETDTPEAKKELLAFLTGRGIEFIDSLVLLPDTTVKMKYLALANVSVCNLRARPSYTSELVSQALMGTPVKILKKTGGWFLVQTPDMYIGWMDSESLVSLDQNEYQNWKSSARLLYTERTGDVLADPENGGLISDIVAGCIVELKDSAKGFYQVSLPDGRNGFISKERCVHFKKFIDNTVIDPEGLVSVARSFTGVPYLWGGTSPKGFDCSGFIKTIYFLNGIITARDASQQFDHGIEINRTAYPDSLNPGDLLFFGSYNDGKPRASHVGMYIGNTEFIHASGMVRINSLDSTRTNFSRSRRNSFLGIRRIAGSEHGHGVLGIQEQGWYN
jgi:uncharacterized protein YgiM (DUF1202 family)